MLLVTSHVVAQDSYSQPRAELKAIVGVSDFGEDQSIPYFVTGAASRIHISRHWSIEPEFNYMHRSANDHDFIFQPNVVYEFHPRGTTVVPYVIGGAGVLRHKGRVLTGSNFFTGTPFTLDTSYTSWTASAGAGLKVFLSKHLFVAPEARIGYQPTARATVSIGYVFPVQD
jgi:hypothetical protein